MVSNSNHEKGGKSEWNDQLVLYETNITTLGL